MASNRTRPSPSLIISTLALLISITGVAAALPGRNTVNSGDIVNGSIRDVDIGEGAVGSLAVADDSLAADDLAPQSVGASELAANSVGSGDIIDGQVISTDIGTASVGSSELAPGSVQASELGNVVVRLGPIVESHAGTPQNGDWAGGMSTAACETGEELISGGARFSSNEGDNVGSELAIGELDFDPDAETVKAIGLNDFYADAQFRATALCLDN
jgi:hypothetical protein